MKLSIGEKIKYLRECHNLTQTALGNHLGMTQRKVSYIENNQCEPSIEDISEICKYFNVSANFLLDLPKDLPYPKQNI